MQLFHTGKRKTWKAETEDSHPELRWKRYKCLENGNCKIHSKQEKGSQWEQKQSGRKKRQQPYDEPISISTKGSNFYYSWSTKKKIYVSDVYKLTRTSLLVVDYKVNATQVTSEHYEGFPPLFNAYFWYCLSLPLPGSGKFSFFYKIKAHPRRITSLSVKLQISFQLLSLFSTFNNSTEF